MLRRFVYNALDDCLYSGEWDELDWYCETYYDIAKYIKYEFDVFCGCSLYELIPYIIEWEDWLYSEYY